MEGVRANSLIGVFLAVVAVVSVSACSDDGGSKIPDAGKADAPGGDNLDVGLPDAPAVEASTPDMAVADAPMADAPVTDLRLPDTQAIDSPIVPPVDAPIGDANPTEAGSIDGGTMSPVARGKYLVDHVIACSDCHTPKLPSGAPDMTKYLAGNPTFINTPAGDTLATPNLTPDPTTGLGNFTGDQIKHMFMDGIVPTASGTMALNPVMPYYVFHNLTADDADAIVAYLQSLPPVNNPIPARSAAFDLPSPANYLDPTTIPMPADTYPQKESAMRGRYLATESGLCIECHTPHLSSGPNPLDTGKFFQGGEDFSAFFAGTLDIHPVSANLTSDPTTGIGTWSTSQIVTVLHQGLDDHGMGICPPMPVGPNGAFGGLTDQDALDIATYLQSLPPAVNDVPDMCSWPPPPPPAMDAGGMDSQGPDGLAMDASAGG